MVALSAADARMLGVAADDLVEMLGGNPAPLRGWVRIPSVPDGTMPLDGFGRKVLGVGNRDTIIIRRLEMPPLPKGMKS
jgi:N-methylhydantoinase B